MVSLLPTLTTCRTVVLYGPRFGRWGPTGPFVERSTSSRVSIITNSSFSPIWFLLPSSFHGSPVFRNQYTFHTGGNQVCNIPEQVPVVNNAPALNFTGSVMHTNCSSTPSSNTGCAVLDAGNSSYGQAFAQVGGGVFALLWNSEGIKIWHFERQSIPGDVHSPNPDPDSWPTPNTFLSAENCDVDSFFSPQWLIFDIDLCGGWANGNYYAPNSGCPVGGTCAQQVTTGSNFISAYLVIFLPVLFTNMNPDATWVINNVTVYNS